MKQIQKFLQDHKYFITWTICYLFVLWAILNYMFGFSIFSIHQWHRLANSRLHGFVGFVFGTLLFTALPIYISTSILIIRKKEPLIKIPLPKIPSFFKKKEPAAPAPETKETKDEDSSELDSNIPPEIRAAFIRAKKHPLDIKINAPDSNSTEDTVNIDDTALPLPTDFDISFDSEKSSDNVPTFTDFSFDDKDENNTDTNSSKVTEYLNDTNTEYSIIDDIIVTKNHAIVTHDDSDFWVVDNENWFASGKTKPSPILAVKSVAEQHNVKPVLYLAEQNIMDIEALIPQWESDGITVITDINNL